MSVWITGDIHGNPVRLSTDNCYEQKEFSGNKDENIVIICGDFGLVWNRDGENANEKNLITGTRYLNVDGMLPFENEVADYVASTGNHVLYRVTPAFVGSELVARGVEMEAYSMEDDGRGVCFHVYCYNVQPGVEIDYATGENWAA